VSDKCVRQVVQNHAELVAKIAKVVSQVADILPQQKLLLILYPTDTMQEAVAQLYAHIIKFVRSTILFYKQGKAMHTIKSIFQPWALSFQDHYESILTLSNRVKDLAGLAAKAELRDTHLEVIEGRKNWDHTNTEVVMLRSEIQSLRALLERKLSAQEQAITSKSSNRANSTCEPTTMLTITVMQQCTKRFA